MLHRPAGAGRRSVPVLLNVEGKKGLGMLRRLSLVMLVSYLLISASALWAQGRQPVRPPIAWDVIGSWFGRAVPVSPFCEPRTEGCPVPHELVMLPTFFADGNFIGIDSQTFGGGAHTTAHGSWTFRNFQGIAANWIFLQSGPGDVFIGGFRMRMHADVVTPDLITGKINAWFFPFTDVSDGIGSVILDPVTGNPDPDPLQDIGPFIDDPADCNPAFGCVGVFEFQMRRIGPR